MHKCKPRLEYIVLSSINSQQSDAPNYINMYTKQQQMDKICSRADWYTALSKHKKKTKIK